MGWFLLPFLFNPPKGAGLTTKTPTSVRFFPASFRFRSRFTSGGTDAQEGDLSSTISALLKDSQIKRQPKKAGPWSIYPMKALPCLRAPQEKSNQHGGSFGEHVLVF